MVLSPEEPAIAVPTAWPAVPSRQIRNFYAFAAIMALLESPDHAPRGAAVWMSCNDISFLSAGLYESPLNVLVRISYRL